MGKELIAQDLPDGEYVQETVVERASLSHMLAWGGGTFLTAGVLDLLAHLGPTGLVVGGIAAFVAARHGQQALDSLHEHVELPTFLDDRIAVRKQKAGRSFLDRALGRFPEPEEVQEEAEEEAEVEETLDGSRDEQEDTVFATASTQMEIPGIVRITIEQIVQHTERNSYAVYIGRSLTRPGHPAVKIDFFKRHLKLIGASQHGKSSMAAALLDVITRTHDAEVVQIALLDLEDKTSRLFAHLPHVARVKRHGEPIRLYARNYEQVLEHLEYISALIDYRYKLSDEVLALQPLLIVYLEEFVDLKDHFKHLIYAAEREERDQAREDYARLVYFIKKIAARGLKVLVQLLMCAQVDYRDDDLQAALVNVTSGMSFCVRPSAAQAAGFYQTELVTRNAKEDKIGQAVVEMPDCKDLVLAPDYDLRARLQALPQTSQERTRISEMVEVSTERQSDGLLPAMQPMGAPLSDLERALDAYDQGNTTINALALALDMSPWNVRPLYTQVKKLREPVG